LLFVNNKIPIIL